jgi:hypothetical protein
LTEITIRKNKLNHLCVDNYPFIIKKEKTSKEIKIYTGYNFISMDDNIIKKENCFVSSKNNFTAHGLTIKKSIEDLNFKIISEKLKKDPIKKDTIITIQYYRLITGACESGCLSWINQNNIKVERMKAIDLLPLLEKSHAYGVEKFKSLITF